MHNYIFITLLPNIKLFIKLALSVSFVTIFFALIPIVSDFMEGKDFKHILLKKYIKYSSIIALICIISLIVLPRDANLALMMN